MSLATIENVRIIGNLPKSDHLADDLITPHLSAATRELTGWIGDYLDSTGDKLDSCLYAECCLAMANLLVPANTFYTEGMLEYQKELGEIEFSPNSPDNTQKLREMWRERAREAVSVWMSDDDGAIKRVSWFAI